MNLILLVLAALGSQASPTQAFNTQPSLTLVIAVDQFRADYLSRFRDKLLPDNQWGFRGLMKKGAYFPMAEFGMLQTMTCPGHATLLTGSYPYRNGIPTNFWNSKTKDQRNTYCAQDPSEALVGGATKAKPTAGASPRYLRGETLGDRLKEAGRPSRVVSLSHKDRAAIMLGGHQADLALWFHSDPMMWTSSTYYLPEKELPQWVREQNKVLQEDGARGQVWKPMFALQPHSRAESPIVKDHKLLSALGPSFPHRAQGSDIMHLPYGLKATTDLALAALTNMNLGLGKAPDLLAISYSATDSIGHMYGQGSREMEEMIYFLDREIHRLVSAIRTQLKGRSLVIAITGDHGAAPNAKVFHPLNHQDTHKGLKDKMNEALVAKLGPGQWVDYHYSFNFFLDHDLIQERGKAVHEVAYLLAQALKSEPSMLTAITAMDVKRRRLPGGLLEKQILRSYVPGRSGDVIAIPHPYKTLGPAPVQHMTGLTYDRMVPLILFGPFVRGGTYAFPVRVIDLAPTLSFFHGVIPPSLSEGRVLHEVLK